MRQSEERRARERGDEREMRERGERIGERDERRER